MNKHCYTFYMFLYSVLSRTRIYEDYIYKDTFLDKEYEYSAEKNNHAYEDDVLSTYDQSFNEDTSITEGPDNYKFVLFDKEGDLLSIDIITRDNRRKTKILFSRNNHLPVNLHSDKKDTTTTILTKFDGGLYKKKVEFGSIKNEYNILELNLTALETQRIDIIIRKIQEITGNMNYSYDYNHIPPSMYNPNLKISKDEQDELEKQRQLNKITKYLMKYFN